LIFQNVPVRHGRTYGGLVWIWLETIDRDLWRGNMKNEWLSELVNTIWLETIDRDL
jgi:hypothetical protein